MHGSRQERRRRLVEPISRRQGGIAGRRQLYALGLTRAEVRAELAARRWARAGRQGVRVGPSDGTSMWWRAVLETGPTAALDGASALLAAGLRTITADTVHVAVPQGAWFRRTRGVRVHETRRYREEDVVRADVPRMRPATAAVHAALWARTDGEAALFVVAAVQQGLVTVPELAEAIARIRRHKRRRLLQGLLRDVGDGVESIDERAFAVACRRRGWPKPTRQVVRRLPSGRWRYDTVWAQYNVEAEIDGAQHLDVANAARDALKQNAATLSGAKVLRIPNFAFRTDPEPFLDQIEAALIAGGWKPSLRQRKGSL